MNEHSAVHVDDGARDVAGQVGGQKQTGTGDILGFAETGEGNTLQDLPLHVVGQLAGGDVRLDEPGVIEFTRMPSGPSSRAIAFANPRTPALAAL